MMIRLVNALGLLVRGDTALLAKALRHEVTGLRRQHPLQIDIHMQDHQRAD